MARRLVERLTARRAATLTAPGNHPDGMGIYLRIDAKGGKSWAFRYKRGDVAHWCGLGSSHDVSLAEARELARQCRVMLRNGLDPITERRRAVARARAGAGPTFEEAARAYIEAHMPEWKNEKHAAQWGATLAAYAFPIMGAIPVNLLDTGHVLAVLRPVWLAKSETASRLRGRIESVLDAATARGWRTGENPARWRGHLDNLLAARSKVSRVVHHAAMPWRELPGLMAKLAESGAVSARCLQFLILTAARSGEARGASWQEIDLDAGVWAIPGERMKAGREHRVPLSAPALAILREMLTHRHGADALVFPGGRPGRPLSDVALAKALRVAGGEDATVHGLRSTFRDWCAEMTAYPREIAETALAHVNRDKTEAAYVRTDHIDQRRRLMAAWADFLSRPAAAAGAVVPLRA